MIDASGQYDEFERKFLLPYLPHEITNGIIKGVYDFEEIEQGYLPNKGGRIRKMTSKDGKISYFFTTKQKVPNTHGLASYEETKAISEVEYLDLIEKIDGEILLKTRYYVPIENFLLEINVFHGRLEGKVLGEVEFENMDQALSFQGVDWMGREVTNEISNSMLAQGSDIPQE